MHDVLITQVGGRVLADCACAQVWVAQCCVHASLLVACGQCYLLALPVTFLVASGLCYQCCPRSPLACWCDLCCQCCPRSPLACWCGLLPVLPVLPTVASGLLVRPVASASRGRLWPAGAACLASAARGRLWLVCAVLPVQAAMLTMYVELEPTGTYPTT